MKSKCLRYVSAAGFGLLMPFSFLHSAASQSAPSKAPEPLPEIYQGPHETPVTAWEKAFLNELKGIKIPEFTLNEASLQEALDKLWSLIPPNQPYLKALKIAPGSTSLPVTLAYKKNAELGPLILSLGPASGTSVREKEGYVTFGRVVDDIQTVGIRIKSETAKKLGLPQETTAKLTDVSAILQKWEVEGKGRYSPPQRLLIVEGTEENRQHLRSLIFFLERGAEIKFPE